ncbi:MAG: hypothetical protein LBQ55_02215 [Treponema sp.]|jgi:hypothetical protein|nr:hypothetical protein [Treponema sp.]
MTRYYYGAYVQDGALGQNTGRAVIYRGAILHAEGPGADHNYLPRSLAARIRADRDDVVEYAALIKEGR